MQWVNARGQDIEKQNVPLLSSKEIEKLNCNIDYSMWLIKIRGHRAHTDLKVWKFYRKGLQSTFTPYFSAIAAPDNPQFISKSRGR